MIEDDSRVVSDYRKILKPEGYDIVEVATTMEEAIALAALLQKSNIPVATVDGRLSGFATTNAHGNEICRLIHEKSPGVIVLGHPSVGKIDGAEYNLLKTASIPDILATLGMIYSKLGC